MLSEERKALARLSFETINSRDLNLLDNHGGYWETRQVFPKLFQAFPDLTAKVEQQTVEGEWVTTRAMLRGTHLGEFLEIAPSGKALSFMHISLDLVREGKVEKHFGVTDWKSLILSS